MATAKKPIRRVQSKGISDIPEQNRGREGVKIQDRYEMFSIADSSNNEFIALRLIGGIVATGTHWVAVENKEGDLISVPKTCLAFDPETMSVDEETRCPYCEAEAWFKDHEIKVKVKNREGTPARMALDYFSNVIPRDLQEDITPKITLESERESGIIEKGSKSKTPIRVVRFTGGVISKIRDVEKLNVHKVKLKGEDGPTRRSMPVSHAKHGVDLMIKYNPKAKTASEYYSVQRGDSIPLDADEKELLKWDVEAWPFENEPATEKEADAEIARMKGKHWVKYRKFAKIEDESDDYDDDVEDDEDDEDDEDEAPRNKKSKAKPKSKSKSRDEDEDEDEDDDLDDDEDDEDDEDEDDEPPRKSKKKPATKSKSKHRDEDEDDEDDDEDDEDLDLDDEDEDDEDDEPPAKKGKKASTSKSSGKKSSKKRQDDDEDEDEDDDLDDEDDEEEDEPPRKSKKKPVAKSKSKSRRDEEDEDDEDDDLDDDEDDEDEDDEPPRKSKKKPVAKSKKSRRDEDEDDEDDDLDDLDEDDEDDEEEDEPPRKSKAKSKSKK